MKVLRKRPYEPWEEIEIENTLEALQAEVGGYVETVTFASDACIVCNEDGTLNDSNFNVSMLGCPFFGTILIVGVDGDEFCDYPMAAARLMIQVYREEKIND